MPIGPRSQRYRLGNLDMDPEDIAGVFKDLEYFPEAEIKDTSVDIYDHDNEWLATFYDRRGESEPGHDYTLLTDQKQLTYERWIDALGFQLQTASEALEGEEGRAT